MLTSESDEHRTLLYIAALFMYYCIFVATIQFRNGWQGKQPVAGIRKEMKQLRNWFFGASPRDWLYQQLSELG